jgi:hypothetical protein
LHEPLQDPGTAAPVLTPADDKQPPPGVSLSTLVCYPR